MKLLIVLLLTVVLTGCVHATYARTASDETFVLTSVFKSVDGLQTQKGDFSLNFDASHTQDPTANILNIIRLLQGLPAPAGGTPNE